MRLSTRGSTPSSGVYSILTRFGDSICSAYSDTYKHVKQQLAVRHDAAAHRQGGARYDGSDECVMVDGFGLNGGLITRFTTHPPTDQTQSSTRGRCWTIFRWRTCGWHRQLRQRRMRRQRRRRPACASSRGIAMDYFGCMVRQAVMIKRTHDALTPPFEKNNRQAGPWRWRRRTWPCGTQRRGRKGGRARGRGRSASTICRYMRWCGMGRQFALPLTDISSNQTTTAGEQQGG
jgi:hypothetical protein